MLEFIKSSEENLYTAQLSASQLWESNFVVSSIRVEDERNNYVEGKVRLLKRGNRQKRQSRHKSGGVALLPQVFAH